MIAQFGDSTVYACKLVHIECICDGVCRDIGPLLLVTVYLPAPVYQQDI